MLSPYWLVFMWAWVQGSECFKVSSFVYIVQRINININRISLLMTLYFMKKLLWWGLNAVLIYGYSNMSSRVILFLLSFINQSNIDLSKINSRFLPRVHNPCSLRFLAPLEMSGMSSIHGVSHKSNLEEKKGWLLSWRMCHYYTSVSCWQDTVMSCRLSS